MVSKGTWRAERINDEWQVISKLPDGESEMIVAKVERARPGFTSPLDASDAKLMAASKELLAKLKDLTSRLRQCGTGPRDLRLVTEADALIDKAEGR